MGNQPPEALARVVIYVNTRRMRRRITELFQAGSARLLPKISLVTDLARAQQFTDIPPAISPLRRRLELTRLIAKLLDHQPGLAPRTALFDLADSLAGLMDEMHGEGVMPGTIAKLDVDDISGHWQRTLVFLSIVEQFMNSSDGAPDIEARQRAVIERMQDQWRGAPPQHPVIVAGSTGSRGATAMFMQLVSDLPQGAVVLPGVDFDMPAGVWAQLYDEKNAEDHPQFRFSDLCQKLKLKPDEIEHWTDTAPVRQARNRLISLALRPVPVTDQWLTEGPKLGDLRQATGNMTLIEAPSQRAEATAVALLLREAADVGRRAALITPDRTLARQVSAVLDRWGIVPDDSAGKPLHLSPPGRFLRHTALIFGRRLTTEALLVLLKHPLTNTGSKERGSHLLHTRELELHLRRYGPPFPSRHSLTIWAEKGDASRRNWAHWLGDLLSGTEGVTRRHLVQHVVHHLALAEQLAAGPDLEGSGALWEAAAGQEALRRIEELKREMAHGGELSPGEYSALINAILQRGEVRDSLIAHPDVMIWGTLEARVQGADLVILSGLNEGIWPEPIKPDPWLNRPMRQSAGLLLPERRIGLAAHDFQQAVAAPEVVLTRSVRDAEAQTVPSRWLNRLTNLLGGLSKTGKPALEEMQARGVNWLRLAETLDRPDTRVPAAPRPSPRPPADARPKTISVTEVQKLIRDPYAVYASRVLGLYPLEPLRQTPDARLRGTVLHRIMERFLLQGSVKDPQSGCSRLLQLAEEILKDNVPWPAARRLWQVRIQQFSEWFVAGEMNRQIKARNIALERKGYLLFEDIGVALRGKLDRVDLNDDGTLAIYDYKTGTVPSASQQRHFDKQLLLSALMAEHGALEGIKATNVGQVAYLGLGGSPKFDPVSLQNDEVAQTLIEFRRLVSAYQNRDQGYTARRAAVRRDFVGDYDHLARFGEWDESETAIGESVGK